MRLKSVKYPVLATVLATALTGTFAVPAMAEDPRWFEIELLIFERQPGTSASGESWPLEVELLALDELPDHIVELDQLAGSAPEVTPDAGADTDSGTGIAPENAEAVPPAKPLPPGGPLRLAEPQLNDISSKLQRHSGYNVLLHRTWQQPVLPPRQAQAVRIYGGQDLSGSFYPHGQPRFSADVLTDEISNFQTPPALWTVDGQFKLWLDRYLYLDTELMLRRTERVTQQELQSLQEPTASEAEVAETTVAEQETSQEALPDVVTETVAETGELSEQVWLAGYKLHQQRRIRSGEIHYLDHPLMGVVLQIRRIEQDPQQ